MGNILIFIIMVILCFLLISGLTNTDKKDGGCNMDCKNCPFPPCNEEEKAWIRNDLHNG